MKRAYLTAFIAIFIVSPLAFAQDEGVAEESGYEESGISDIIEYTEESGVAPEDELQIHYGGDYEGVVTRVIDAGRIEIDGEEVELLGVDAPRRDDDGAARDCYSYESASYLESRVLGKHVTYAVEQPPKYGRLLGTKHIYLYIGHSMLNSELIRKGMAFADVRDTYPEMDYFLKLQDNARRRHAGLWHTCPVECNRHGDCETKDW